MKENILCSAQYIFYYLQSGWFINRPLVWDLPMKSSGLLQEDR